MFISSKDAELMGLSESKESFALLPFINSIIKVLLYIFMYLFYKRKYRKKYKKSSLDSESPINSAFFEDTNIAKQ